MTVCNMTIEGGGRAGMIAPDETTFEWFAERRAPPLPPVASSTTRSSAGASCAATRARASTARSVSTRPQISPQVTWGTNPGMVGPVTRPRARAGGLRQPRRARDRRARAALHGARARHPDRGDLASTACSSARAPTRASATCAPPPRSSPDARSPTASSAMVVPGSQQVKAQAEAEGLDRIFREAGFDWRVAGCSMCLGMNPDILQPGRALRLDLEPQLRGPPGPRRAHPPRLAADGRRGRRRGALRRHPELGTVSAPTPGATWQQADLATSFLAHRADFVPMLEVQEDLVSRLLAAARTSRRTRFLDLGCGDGALTQLVLDVHPSAEAVLLDFSEPMLAHAARAPAAPRRARCAGAGRPQRPRVDASSCRGGRFDAIVSGLAIHHLPAERKRALFAELFELLGAGRRVREHGLRARRGPTAGSLRREEDGRAARRARRAARARHEEVIIDEDDDDRPDLAQAQVQWLRDAGFEHAEVQFKWAEAAVLAGFKPDPREGER